MTEWTWGHELELGDVVRSLTIPAAFGEWNYAETDIVNQREPYRYQGADPLGIDPPVGGEVNVRPGRTIDEVVNRIGDILGFFKNAGCPATISSSIMEGHVHVRVPGLRDDIAALKRLTRYVIDNQITVVRRCVQYQEHPQMRFTKTARTYLKWDMGRTMPVWMGENIIKSARDFKEFIHLQRCGKDGVSVGRPFRYCINTYCLSHIDTIEFRCFRATLDSGLLKNCFLFVRDFMEAALTGGPSAEAIIRQKKYVFPPFLYNHEEYLGWEKSKWPTSRTGKKVRKYVDLSMDGG